MAHPWHFSVLGNKTLCTVQKNSKKCSLALLHFLWRHLGRIFSISQVDFACLIKSSSLTSCLTSPSSLLPGAYSSAGATSQTDCCPAGMGLAAHRGPEAQSPCAFVWIWSVVLEGVKQGERIEVIPSSSGLLPRGTNPPVNHWRLQTTNHHQSGCLLITPQQVDSQIRRLSRPDMNTLHVRKCYCLVAEIKTCWFLVKRKI